MVIKDIVRKGVFYEKIIHSTGNLFYGYFT